MKSLGNAAIGLNIVSGVYNVATTCTGLESCGRETAKQTCGVAGGYVGGAGGAILVSLSIFSAPVVVVVVGVGALLGGVMGAGRVKTLVNICMKRWG
ncbi:hypothetical protein [Moritella viscosa]|uniref:hypothetical protein n=1 Tax=Moritella viscosa TaxID=80854 RepID=UPI00094C7EB4|nr:hypothetical protein [Moritella viscosa]